MIYIYVIYVIAWTGLPYFTPIGELQSALFGSDIWTVGSNYVLIELISKILQSLTCLNYSVHCQRLSKLSETVRKQQKHNQQIVETDLIVRTKAN